jgi:hypothetical protein
MNDIFNDKFLAEYYALRAELADEHKLKLDQMINNAVEQAVKKGIDYGIQQTMAKVDETVKKVVAEEEMKGEEA